MRKEFLAGVAVVALAASFGGSTTVSAQQPGLMNWSGFYVGAHAGWGWARFNGTWIDTSGDNLFPWRTKPSGFLAGLHTGQNWQVNTFVYGWEGDVSFTSGWDQTLTGFNTTSQSVLTKMSLLASLRARLGVLLNPSTLVYATGGLAYTNAKATGTDPANSPVTTKFNTFGGVVGLGAEWKQTQNFSWRLEGLYYVFNKSNFITVSGANQYLDVKLKDALAIRIAGTWYFP
jgi:outer membrane immunogenic protein